MATPWKHPNGTFYVRERVPSDLLSIAKDREVHLQVEGEIKKIRLGQTIKLSLETKELRIAKERYRAVAAEVQNLWSRLRQERDDGPEKLSAKQISPQTTLGTDFR